MFMLNYTRQVVQIEGYESTGLNRKTTDLHMHMHMHRQPLLASLLASLLLPAFLHFAPSSDGCTACGPRNSTVYTNAFFLNKLIFTRAISGFFDPATISSICTRTDAIERRPIDVVSILGKHIQRETSGNPKETPW
jgi:hypothetical protein